VSAVSLNRCEQRIFDYLQAQPEERRHWQRKIQTAAKEGSAANAVSRLEGELWRYYLERSAVATPFRDAARHEGLHRTSMRNLAELLIRLWTEPPARARPPVEGAGA
jgi:hypothetical protein